jgi:hypothetical protein
MDKVRRLAFFYCFLAIVALIAGCAAPMPKSEATPKLYASVDNSVALAVIEARPYVLDGTKTPEYEGFLRGAFGIPNTVYRPNRPEGERFVDQLAGLVRDGLAQEGVKVAVLPMPLGASVEETLVKLSQTDARRYLVIHVADCNWEFGLHGMTSTWKYNFGVTVAGPAGFQTRNKRFTDVDTSKLPKADSYNVFDNYSIHYRRVIESMFDDPQIRQALQN